MQYACFAKNAELSVPKCAMQQYHHNHRLYLSIHCRITENIVCLFCRSADGNRKMGHSEVDRSEVVARLRICFLFNYISLTLRLSHSPALTLIMCIKLRVFAVLVQICARCGHFCIQHVVQYMYFPVIRPQQQVLSFSFVAPPMVSFGPFLLFHRISNGNFTIYFKNRFMYSLN